MTKPTTAECIEWLDNEIEVMSGMPVRQTPEYIERHDRRKTLLQTIRAKLLAAQEMVKALEFYRVNWNNYDVGDKLDRRPTSGLLEDAGVMAAQALDHGERKVGNELELMQRDRLSAVRS